MVKASRRSSFRKLWKNLNGRLQRSTYTYSYRMSSWKVRWNHWKIDWIASAIGIHLQTRYTNYKRCTILGQIYKRPRRISCLLWWWLDRGQIWQELYQRLSCLVWWKLIVGSQEANVCCVVYSRGRVCSWDSFSTSISELKRWYFSILPGKNCNVEDGQLSVISKPELRKFTAWKTYWR